jgi:hypothetical protein
METSNKTVDKMEETEAGSQCSDQPTGFEKVKNRIADKLHHAAETLCEIAAKQDGQSGFAQYEKQASEWLDHSAECVRQFDYRQADTKVRDYVKQNPGRSLLIAGAAGLIIGAMLRRR